MSRSTFVNKINTSENNIILYNSVIRFSASYQIPGTRSRKRLVQLFILTG